MSQVESGCVGTLGPETPDGQSRGVATRLRDQLGPEHRKVACRPSGRELTVARRVSTNDPRMCKRSWVCRGTTTEFCGESKPKQIKLKPQK